LKLSGERAGVVYSILKDMGINDYRMKAEGYGIENPICPVNDTKECQAQNRRIDIIIMSR
jgi:K(+)-stimulated pyrophosphate-energized sodium pump